jgi:hypothetical protein
LWIKITRSIFNFRKPFIKKNGRKEFYSIDTKIIHKNVLRIRIRFLCIPGTCVNDNLEPILRSRVTYNASAVKIYNGTSSLERFGKTKIVSFTMEKPTSTLAL